MCKSHALGHWHFADVSSDICRETEDQLLWENRWSGELSKASTELPPLEEPGDSIFFNETQHSSHSLYDDIASQAAPAFMVEEEKIRDMNVTQNRMTHLSVGKKKIYTKQKQKAQEWINLFMNLWVKETLIFFLVHLIHSRSGKVKGFTWVIDY